MVSIIMAAVLGGSVALGIMFLVGQLHQQRKQVLELRQTNVTLFGANNELKNAYAYLQEQVKKIQSGPVAAVLSFEERNAIAELVAAKIDFKSINGKEIEQKLKN